MPEPTTMYAAWLTTGDLIFDPERPSPVEVVEVMKGPVIGPGTLWTYTVSTDDYVTEPYLSTDLVAVVRVDGEIPAIALPRGTSSRMGSLVEDMLIVGLRGRHPEDPLAVATVDQALATWKADHPEVTLIASEWLITNDPASVRAWPLPHVCADCVDGQLKAIEATEAGDTVGLCHLTYQDAGL